MLRAFHVGNALISDGEPSSWMRSSRMAWAQLSWPACHLTKASASAVMKRSSSKPGYFYRFRCLPFDEQPISLTLRPAGEVEADDNAPIREPVSAKCVAHRPQGNKRIEVFGDDFEPMRAPFAEQLADREKIVAGRSEFVMMSAPVGLESRLDDIQPF